MDGWVGGFEFARGMSRWVDGWMGGWVDGWFMKLMKRKKKRKITLSFTSPETDFFFISMKSLHRKINKKSADIYYLYIYIFMYTHI